MWHFDGVESTSKDEEKARLESDGNHNLFLPETNNGNKTVKTRNFSHQLSFVG